jgi:hypothetical protein
MTNGTIPEGTREGAGAELACLLRDAIDVAGLEDNSLMAPRAMSRRRRRRYELLLTMLVPLLLALMTLSR